MNRITLTDSPNWFDADAAVGFDEATRWDGNNHISVATGSQWDHERLYWTASGNWVLNYWSQWEGRLESYSEVDEARAIEWLIRNQYAEKFTELDELPEAVRERVEAGYEAAEL